MIFEEPEINDIDLKKAPLKIVPLLYNDFCGETQKYTTPETDNKILDEVMETFQSKGLSFGQLNEILLILNQPTMKKPFFDFFFGKEKISIHELKQGIIKFRGYALLCFGNFRFAFKKLISVEKNELEKLLKPCCVDIELDNYTKRPEQMLSIQKIAREDTWLTGYLSGTLVEIDRDTLEGIKKKEISTTLTSEQIDEYEQILYETSTNIKPIQEKALHNTDVYLTWEYMDIYVATSMRQKWEFEQIYDFIEGIEPTLSKQNVRFFDPTQSSCDSVRDKGLIESLMLKRAFLTIYLAQESDTIGKDSELAATLAQRKPVIAYVPEYNPKDYEAIIANYPIEFFKNRLLSHLANGTFEDPKFKEYIGKEVSENIHTVLKFINEIYEYRKRQPFLLYYEQDEKFKQNALFKPICEILSKAECFSYNSRAELLKGRHPLSMQADLTTGVANGVIVVRTPKQCIDIIEKIMSNELEFVIERNRDNTSLTEKSTGSKFRVVTNNKRLTNSFWNYFLK